MNRELWLQIKKHSRPRFINVPTFAVLAVDVFLFVTSWAAFNYSGWLLVPAYLTTTLAFVHVYLILHEATHSAVSTNTVINDLVGHFCGWLVLMPFLPRQTSHLLHHTWTGHPVRDPANKRMIQKFSVITKKEINQLESIWKYWFPAIIINDRIGLWRAPHNQSSSGKQTKRVKQEIFWNRIYLAGYIVLFLLVVKFDHIELLVKLYLPSLFIGFLVEELVNLPHHAETPLLNASDKALPYWEQHKVTHSCRELPIWSKYILLNFNLHVAHHFYPNAAWHELPELHIRIKKEIPVEIQNTEHTNEFTWSFINRRRPLLSIMGHYFDRVRTGVESKNDALT